MALILIVGCASADFWSGYIGTNTTSWSIYRESTNVNFYYEQHVSGKIEAVDGPNNRSLNSYYSCYSNVDINDVSIKERLAAFKGKYKCDEIEAMAARDDNVIESDIAKPAGSDEYTLNYRVELAGCHGSAKKHCLFRKRDKCKKSSQEITWIMQKPISYIATIS